MDEINQHAKETEHEVDDDMMVEEAYQRLLKSYLSSPHRKGGPEFPSLPHTGRSGEDA